MTQGFDKWYRDARDITVKAGWDAGQQSRQAEVDELQRRIDKALSDLWDAKSKAAPDGWILAPKEPNEKQKRTAMFITAQNGNAIDAYKGMIADLEVSTQ